MAHKEDPPKLSRNGNNAWKISSLKSSISQLSNQLYGVPIANLFWKLENNQNSHFMVTISPENYDQLNFLNIP